jgi:hypothetical protein
MENDEILLFNPEQERPADKSAYKIGHCERGWLKNFVAVIIGIIVGLLLRIITAIVIGIPLVLIFSRGGGTASDPKQLPLDIEFIFEIFIAFVAGAMAGSLVPRLGWLIGALTQFLNIILIITVLGFTVFFAATKNPKADLLSSFWLSSDFRIMLFGIVIAAVGGALGVRYRFTIWAFLKSVFGFLGFILSFLAYATGSILYLYFLYRAGKALFEDGAVLKAAFWGLVIGPIVSYVVGLSFFWIIWFGSWIFTKVYNWYASDLGFQRLDYSYSL